MFKTNNKKILLFSGIFLALIISVLWYSFSYSYSEYGDYESAISIPADSGSIPYIDFPEYLAISPNNGNIYLSDSGSYAILVFNSNDEYLYKISSPGFEEGRFAYPKGIAIGTEGENQDVIYVADSGNNKILKLNYLGEFITEWGEEGSGNSQFSSPRDIALDSLGNLYVIDEDNNRIQKFDSDGNYITQWGDSGSGNSQFDMPSGIAVDSSNNIYVADTHNNRVQKFDSDGNYITQWGSWGTGVSNFWDPMGITIDNLDNVYVVDRGENNKVRKFDINGNFLEIIISGYGDSEEEYQEDGNIYESIDIEINLGGDIYISDKYNRFQKFSLDIKTGHYLDLEDITYDAVGNFNFPRGVFIDNLNDIYVVDSYNNRIQKFDSAGNYIEKFLKYGSGPGEVNRPVNINMDSYGNIYIVDQGNNRIQKFDSDWNYITQWGGEGSQEGQFSYPSDLAIFNDNIYVADASNNRIQVFDLSGNFLFAWGDASLFFEPQGIEINEFGKVLVADTKNDKIQIFGLDGQKVAEFGSSGSGDGQFKAPVDLVASSSDLYIIDYGNNRIQKVDEDGNYLGQWGIGGTGDGEFQFPRSLAIDVFGGFYVSDSGNHRIQYFSAEGVYDFAWGAYEAAGFSFTSLANDGHHNIYASINNDNGYVFVFNSAGDFVEKFEGVGGFDGELINPMGSVFDSDGNFYVYDDKSCLIKKFDPNGFFELEWGGCGSSDGEFGGGAFFMGMAVDSYDNIYVADTNNNRIQVFNSIGDFQEKWSVDSPSGLVIDSNNNIFVADIYSDGGENVRGIIKFNAARQLVTQWSQGHYLPYGLAVDSSDNIYVLYSDNSTILKYDNNGEQIGDLNDFSFPTSFILVDSLDGLYVANESNTGMNRIAYGEHLGYVFDTKIVGEVGSFAFKNPFSVSLGSIEIPEIGLLELLLVADSGDSNIKIFSKVDGSFQYMSAMGGSGSELGKFSGPSEVILVGQYMYIADAMNHRIQRFDVFEQSLISWGSFGDGPGQFGGESLIGDGYILGMTADFEGNIYVTDTFNNRVQKFDADGNYITEWEAVYPLGIAIDNDSNIFTSSPFANVIEKFDSNGDLIKQWGETGSENGQFNLAAGLFVDFNNYLYVADGGNNRIQKFDKEGTFMDKWGEPGYNLGEFDNPLDVVVDNDGNIYIADVDNKRIQILYISAQEPYDLAVSNSTVNSITLSWQGNTYNYYIENITNSDSSDWIQNNSYTFSNLTCGENYSFKVKGKTYSGEETDWSDILNYSITCPDSEPDPDPESDPESSSVNYSSELPLPICDDVEYNDWETCKNGFDTQFRSIKKTDPANCYLSVEQRQAMKRFCSLDDYEEGQKIVDDNKFENIDQGYLLNIKNIALREKSLVSNVDAQLVNRLKGFVLLQKENYGELWYVNPVDNLKYYMGNPLATFNIMRGFGLGVSNQDFELFEKNGVPDRLLGRIILKVESHGEAYYINPVTREMYYLSRPHEAFEIFGKLALGISNINIRKIEVGLQ